MIIVCIQLIRRKIAWPVAAAPDAAKEGVPGERPEAAFEHEVD